MKTMCPPRYHHSGPVATHAAHAQVPELLQGHYGDNLECIVFMITYMLHPCCLCEISALHSMNHFIFTSFAFKIHLF